MANDLQLLKNGKVEIEAPTDDHVKHCARIILSGSKEQGTAVKALDLRRGTVTSVGAGYLAKALKGTSTLRHLALEGNGIGDAGVKTIGIAMEDNHNCALTYLDLSSTGITVVGLKDLAQGAAKLPGLHTLCLSDNNLAQEAGHQLSNLLRASVSLHTIFAAGNYLGDRGLAALCGALCHLKPARVVSLDVSSNGVGDLGVQWLTKGISALCRQKDTMGDASSSRSIGGIRDLRLRGNNITHAGAQELAKLLSEDRCARELRELDISLNTITNDGFKPLAVSLKGCRELVRLDVSGCRLGPGGVKAAAKLLSDAPPRLSKVNLTPKAEFADRVLSDRDGLAVALRQSLQLVADALPFAGTVVDLSLGYYLRADPAAAAGIEQTLQEHRERMGVATGLGADGGPGAEGAEHNAGRKDVVDNKSGPRHNERPRGTSKSGTASGNNSRTKSIIAESGVSSSGSGRRGDTSTQRSTSGRSRDRQGTMRSSGIERPRAGIERPKAGLERTKANAAERARRNAGGHSSGAPTAGINATPPSGPSSLSRTSSKASVRSTPGSGRSSQKTTAATLAARDRAAAAAAALSSSSPQALGAPHHRRMHQGEELDSIDGFTPLPTPSPSTRHTPPSSSTTASRRHGGGRGAASTRGSAQSGGVRGTPASARSGPGAATSASGSTSNSLSRKSSARGMTAVADVVSEVMRDTAAMDDYPDTPPPVAPSTWQEEGEKVANTSPDENPPDLSCSPSSAIEAMPSPAGALMRPPTHKTLGGGGEESSRKKLFRKNSSSSSVKDVDEPEMAEEMASLALTTDNRGSQALSTCHETAIEASTASGAGAQQLITVAQAGQLLAPMVASQVAKETKRIELKFQNDLNMALGKVRLEIQSIDREGLVARVALEKRVNSGIKRLVEKFDQLERRYARMEREERERKRLALEASGSSGAAGAAHSALAIAGVTPPRPRRAALTAAPPPPPGALGTEAAVAAGEWWDGGGGLEGNAVGSSGGGAVRSRRAGNGSAATGIAMRGGGPHVVPESARPSAVWGEGGVGGANDGGLDSGVATSEEEFLDSCDEAEAEMVRRLEEKMAALEGKLRGHEERQRTDYVGVDEDAFGQGSAVYA